MTPSAALPPPENALEEPTTEAPSPETKSGETPRRSFRSISGVFALAAVCVELGLLLGTGVFSYKQPIENHEVADAEPEFLPPVPEANVNQPLPEFLTSIDVLIRSGDYKSALARCQSRVADEPAIELRIALCHEALHQLRKAMEIYGKLSGVSDVTTESAAALTGLARCAVQLRQTKEANTAISNILEHSTHPAFVGKDARMEALCLKAILERNSEHTEHATSAHSPVPLEGPLLALIATDLERWIDTATDYRGPTAEIQNAASEGNDPTNGLRALWNDALAAAPRPTWTSAICVEFGDLDMEANRPHSAAVWYERAIPGLPAHAKLAAVHNLGVARFHALQFTQARMAFLHAIDCGPDPRTVASCWYWIGRSYLDSGEVSASRVPFKKANSIATDPELRVLSALALATVCLSDGDRAGAHAILAQNHADLHASEHQSFAAVVDHVACMPKRANEAHNKRLIEALINVPDESPIGPAGIDLLGRELQKAGFGDRMKHLYEATLPICHGAWAVRMSQRLAENHFEAGEFDKALLYFQSVAAADRKEAGAHAVRRVAEIALRQDRIEDCLAQCRTALSTPKLPKSEILKVMGEAFERSGDMARAARCYAGHNPDE